MGDSIVNTKITMKEESKKEIELKMGEKEAKVEEKKKKYEVDVYKSFDDMGLKENLLRGLYSMGYENPSVIQQRAIVPVYRGKDVIAQSQSDKSLSASIANVFPCSAAFVYHSTAFALSFVTPLPL